MSQLLRFTGKDIQDVEWTSWIETKPQALHALAEKWFSAIKNCGSDVEDIFHDHYPIGCVNEAPFAYVNVFSKHVNVGFFYGADLPDERQLLEGTGKRMRHIKLKPDLVYDETAIESLIAAAYDDIKERLENEHLKSI